MITVKSAATLMSVVLLLSALPVRAQGCSLSGDTLMCHNLDGNVARLIDFLNNLNERALSQIRIL
jgi:hypothetical protein